ncbi:hypothetical protein PIB30_000065 [Stylosanthes scabra]|uniref:Uncharacterized protein n=1 Tax=Stylosanthes scabra TaxID=79078 RepID=A0ABU6Q3A8_9FABA|nr:hypothetical protein [Stylosanthes scabra]
MYIYYYVKHKVKHHHTSTRVPPVSETSFIPACKHSLLHLFPNPFKYMFWETIPTPFPLFPIILPLSPPSSLPLLSFFSRQPALSNIHRWQMLVTLWMKFIHPSETSSSAFLLSDFGRLLASLM